MTSISWKDVDSAARMWQAASAVSLAVPEPTVSKFIALSGILPSVYLGLHGLWKISDRSHVAEGLWDVGTSLLGAAVYLRVANQGAQATRLLITSKWNSLPKFLRYGIPTVVLYPFVQEFSYSLAMEIRTHLLSPYLKDNPLFPSMQGINSKSPYEIQIEQEDFRQKSLANQAETLQRLDALEKEKRDCYCSPTSLSLTASH